MQSVMETLGVNAAQIPCNRNEPALVVIPSPAVLVRALPLNVLPEKFALLFRERFQMPGFLAQGARKAERSYEALLFRSQPKLLAKIGPGLTVGSPVQARELKKKMKCD